MPRVKRVLASLKSVNCRAVLRTLTASKAALSSRTLVVAAVTSVSSPPMTPASATGPTASAMTRCAGFSERVTLSSVTSVSPSRARRTVIAGVPPPARLTSAS